MIAPHTRRGPYEGSPTSYAPNAALLIDFDNVTMAIRSDLGKELKALLNSDIIKGKVSVQRAYADWRRYPQYIVPLAESSVDLIFAPAYGSSKKNATDLRMAIDAMELVFTRPEIGTFILLTGDSDFSSCVLKLKEYGKYVIGVGMRESASDLLIQNCDEYYSYHAISGLTRTGEVTESKEDPWVLVRRATEQMIANGDVMRTDRLKQVMMSLDPAFDEKKLGYPKFSRFVSEASRKGLLRLRKTGDGQQEIVLGDDEKSEESAVESAAPAERGRSRDRRRDDGRHRRREPVAEEAKPEPVAAAEAAPATQPELELPIPGTEATPAEVTELQSAYALLQQALRALSRNGEAVRDGDVKRKMLEISPDFDEGKLGFSKFSRFLRQAHDAEAVDLRRVDSGQYEVSVGSRAVHARAPVPPVREDTVSSPAASAPATLRMPETEPETPVAPEPLPLPIRGRRGRGGRAEAGPPPILPGQVIRPVPVAAPPLPEAEPVAEAAAPAAEPAVPEAVTESPEITPPAPRRGRRGGRRRDATAEAPPPVLPGQSVTVPAEPEAATPTDAEESAEADTAAEEPQKRRKSRPRTRKVKPAEEVTAAAEEPTPPAFSAADLGLPRDRDSVIAYLSNSYKGIGKKTAETLLDTFGEDLFRGLQEEPDRVREVLDNRRATTILDQWAADYERRSAANAEEETAETAESQPAAEEPSAAAGDSDPEEDDNGAKRGRTRGRRGGRGRGGSRKKKAEPASA